MGDTASVAVSRTPWWLEFLVLLALLAVYLLIRHFAFHKLSLAIANGRLLLAVEHHFGVAPEVSLNRWLTSCTWLGKVASGFYDLAALAITPPVAIFIWFRGRPVSEVARNEMVISLLIAFAVFAIFPVAPPRLVDGQFISIGGQGTSVGSWYLDYFDQLDQLAALPSIHVISACWCFSSIWKLAASRIAKRIAVLIGGGYIAVTSFVVMATANHYLLDVLAGIGTATLAVVVVGWLFPLSLRFKEAKIV